MVGAFLVLVHGQNLRRRKRARMVIASGNGCRHHDEIEERLREKRDRITILEQDVKHMKEKLDLIVDGQTKVLETMASLKTWQTYLVGAAGAIALIYSVLSAHWAAVVKLFGG